MESRETKILKIINCNKILIGRGFSDKLKLSDTYNQAINVKDLAYRENFYKSK